MKNFIAQSIFLFAEIGVVVVMLMIIIKERRKNKVSQKKAKKNSRDNLVSKSQTLYLD